MENKKNTVERITAHLKRPDERTKRALEGHIGPSDLSGCARAVKYTMLKQPRDESRYELAPKFGTAWHAMLDEAAGSLGFPYREYSMEINLDGEHVIHGTADLIVPEENTVYDHKTAANLDWVKKHGANEDHIRQVHLYALGAIQQGLIEASQAMGCIVYWDKSATVDEPYAVYFDIRQEVISDLVDKYRSILRSDLDQIPFGKPLEFCLSLCPFASTCRRDFFESPDKDDPEVYALLDDFQRVKAAIKALEMEKKEIEASMSNVPGGRFGDYQVKWVHVRDALIPEFTRRGYSYLRVTKARSAK